MLLFGSEEALQDWLGERGYERGATMTLEQCWDLARRWYTGRAEATWRPRTREQAERVFASVGLEGSFWSFEPGPDAEAEGATDPGELAVQMADLADLSALRQHRKSQAAVATFFMIPFAAVPVLLDFRWYAVLPAVLWALYTLTTWTQYAGVQREEAEKQLSVRSLAGPNPHPPRLMGDDE